MSYSKNNIDWEAKQEQERLKQEGITILAVLNTAVNMLQHGLNPEDVKRTAVQLLEFRDEILFGPEDKEQEVIMILNGKHLRVLARVEALAKLQTPEQDSYKILWNLISEFEKEKAITTSWLDSQLVFDWHRYRKLVHKQRVQAQQELGIDFGYSKETKE